MLQSDPRMEHSWKFSDWTASEPLKLAYFYFQQTSNIMEETKNEVTSTSVVDVPMVLSHTLGHPSGSKIMFGGTKEDPLMSMPLQRLQFKEKYLMQWIQATPEPRNANNPVFVTFGYDVQMLTGYGLDGEGGTGTNLVKHVFPANAGKYPKPFDKLVVKLNVNEVQFIREFENCIQRYFQAFFLSKEMRRTTIPRFMSLLNPDGNIAIQIKNPTKVFDCTEQGLVLSETFPQQNPNGSLHKNSTCAILLSMKSVYVNPHQYGLVLTPLFIYNTGEISMGETNQEMPEEGEIME